MFFICIFSFLCIREVQIGNLRRNWLIYKCVLFQYNGNLLNNC